MKAAYQVTIRTASHHKVALQVCPAVLEHAHNKYYNIGSRYVVC